MVRKRISFSLSSDPNSIETRLFDYLRHHNKMVSLREAMVRSLKAYYLPWAYEDAIAKEEVQVLARHAIDELEFRIFQIRRHFLAGEPYGPKLSVALDRGESFGSSSAIRQNEKATSVQQNSQPTCSAATILNPADSAKLHPAGKSTSVHQMLEDTDISPGVLDDF